MNPGSVIVCQIPDCNTTQLEIESEMSAFLSGYCTICRKERSGKLCGCAFPCSLNFRSQMMRKIHDLLNIKKPPDRKTIQVRTVTLVLASKLQRALLGQLKWSM